MGTIRAIMDLTRVIPNQIMIGLGVVVGEIVGASGVPGLREIVLGFAGPAMLGASTFAMNDYFDLESDRLGGRSDRPLVRGDISPGSARLVFLLGFPLGLILSSAINAGCLLIAVVFSILALAYNLRLKETGLPGNLFIASTMGIPFIYGSVAVGGEISLAVVTLAMMAFLSGAGREIVKDIMDAKGDEARGSRSLARSRGVGFAARGSGGFFLIAVCLSPLPFVLPSGGTYYMNPLYIVPVALTDLLLCYVAIRSVGIREPSDAVPLRGMSLLALNVGLIGFLLGAF